MSSSTTKLRVATGVLVFSALLSLNSWAAHKTHSPASRVRNSNSVHDENDEDDDDDAASEDDDDSDDDDDDEESGSLKPISGNVSIASDYVLRGMTQTNHQPSLQGELDWEHFTGLSLGLWGSNVAFIDAASSLELDFYGAYTYHFTEAWNMTLGAAYFSYFENSDRNGWDYSLKVQRKTLWTEVAYSPGWRGEGGVWYLSAGWMAQVISGFELNLAAGYSFFNNPDSTNYPDFKASISREFFGVEWQLSGIFLTQQELNGVLVGPQAILSVTKRIE